MKSMLKIAVVAMCVLPLNGLAQEAVQVVEKAAPAPAPTGPAAPEVTEVELTPGPSVTLSEALDAASRRNLDLQAAEMEIEKAKAGLKKSWGMLLPYVQAKMDYTHMDHEDTVDLASSFTPLIQMMGIQLPEGTDLGDPLLTNPQEKLVGALQVQMPLINPEGWLTVRTAKQGVKVAENAIETARRQILLGTAQAYYMVITTRDLIDFYQTQIRTAAEQLRIANARFRAGRGMRIDVIRAETDLEQARQSLISAQLSFDNARDTLGILTGMEGLPMPSDAPALYAPSEPVDELTAKARAARTDIKTAEEKVELAERQKNAVWAQFVPSLGLGFQGSYQFTDLPDLGSDDKSRWALMLSLTVPIYNHFRYGDLDEKRAALKQAQLALRNTEDKSSLAVRTAQRNYAAALTTVATARKQEALAAEGLKLTEAAYVAGSGDSLSVTNARQTHAAAGFNRTTLELKAQLALLSLLDAVGENLEESIASK